MNAVEFLNKAINPKRYHYFFNKKNIDAPNPTVLCRSISQQLQVMVKNDRNCFAGELFYRDNPEDFLFYDFHFHFLFRSSPVDEINELVPFFFSMLFEGDGYGERYHGSSIWSDMNKDFYTFIIAASAPAATTVLDYNFATCLNHLYEQESDGADNSN